MGLTGELADGGGSGGLSSELFESCFRARRNLVCPSFVPLAMFRVSHRCKQDEERPGEWQGRERNSERHRGKQAERPREERDVCKHMSGEGGRGQRSRDTDRERETERGEGLAGQKAGERHGSTEGEKRRKGERDKNREKERKKQKGKRIEKKQA